ncbi:MAG: S-layer homology domain-containing protein [Oscillospiraceae bacterium]|nr:S-layer homology domain-containing protein [Oscillospiraceae bacterium]
MGLQDGFDYVTSAPAALTIVNGTDINIDMVGASSFVSTGTGANAAGINSASANITVTGAGSLSASASAGMGINSGTRSFTIKGGVVNAAAGNGSNTHGISVGNLTIERGALNASSGGPSTTGAYFGINATSLTLFEGDGVITASGNSRAINSTPLSLPGGYEYLKGSKADGSNASAFSVPGEPPQPYVYAASNSYVRIQARERHMLSVSGGTDVTGLGAYFAGELVTVRAAADQPGIVSPTTNPTNYPFEWDVFKSWTGGDGGTFTDSSSITTTFKMPDNNASIDITTQIAYKLYVSGGFIYMGPYQSTNNKLGYYLEGSQIPLGSYAQVQPNYYFNGWEVVDSAREIVNGSSLFSDANSLFTVFTVPAGGAAIEAKYLYNDPGFVNQFTINVLNGSIVKIDGTFPKSEFIERGTTITILADAPPRGQEFERWEITYFSGNSSAYAGAFSNITSPSSSFTMAEGNVTITAMYRYIDYSLNVVNGEGSGSHRYDDKVDISAEMRVGEEFIGWTIGESADNGGVSGGDIGEFGKLFDSSALSTTFTMPANNVTVFANYEDIYYQLTVDKGKIEGGSDEGSYKAGDIVTIIADTRPGEVFSGWTCEDGGEIVDAGSMKTTFIMPPNVAVVSANYEPQPAPEPTRHLTVDGGNGSGEYRVGEAVDISADAAPAGMRFDKWTTNNGGAFDNSNSMETTFYMPGDNVTVTAVYDYITYTLTVENGTGSGDYIEGFPVTIEADVAPIGQEFARWIGGDDAASAGIAGDSSSPTTFTMPAGDATVTAHYENIIYHLDVEGAGGSGDYAFGEIVEITAEPPEGERFTGWTGGDGGDIGDSDSIKTTFIMPPNDATVTATYTPINTDDDDDYLLEVVDGIAITEVYLYKNGEEVVIRANDPPYGKEFSGWTTDDGGAFDNSSDLETTFHMPDNDVTITANYTNTKYALTVEDGVIVENGDATGKYSEGELVPIKTFPEEEEHKGQEFTGWTVSGSGSVADPEDPETTFTMGDGNSTVTANYKYMEYWLEVNEGSGSGFYRYGDKVEIAANLRGGKRFTDWTVTGGGDIGDVNSMRTDFIMPDRDVIITANYVVDALAYYLTVINGSSDRQQYFYLDQVDITADVAPVGQEFFSWTSDSGGIFIDSGSQSTTFYMPGSDVIVTANYVNVTYTLTVENGVGSGHYGAGEHVDVLAETRAGQKFIGWTGGDGGEFENASQVATIFNMPAGDAVVTAVFEPVDFELIVEKGFGSGRYSSGEQVLITADPRLDGQRFSHWEVLEGAARDNLVNPDVGTTTFIMPEHDATVAAIYVNFYELTVVNGSGSGRYNSGDTVVIEADPAPEGQVFDRWTTDNERGAFQNANSGRTVFTMPTGNTTVTATYKDASNTDGADRDRNQNRGGGGVVPLVSGDLSDSVGESRDEASDKDGEETGGGDMRPVDVFNHIQYIQGIGDNLFAPEENMTRAEAAQMFYNLLENRNNIEITKSFPDIPAGSWYERAVYALASLGIIEGFPDGLFYPEAFITRAEFVAIVVRFDGEKAGEGAVMWFNDVPEEHWAYGVINAAIDYGWIAGDGVGSFHPDRDISRDEAVTLTNRALKRSPDKSYINSHDGSARDAGAESANGANSAGLAQFSDVPNEHWAYYEIMEAYHTHRFLWSGNEEKWEGVDY